MKVYLVNYDDNVEVYSTKREAKRRHSQLADDDSVEFLNWLRTVDLPISKDGILRAVRLGAEYATWPTPEAEDRIKRGNPDE